jgi:hypothetical protein
VLRIDALCTAPLAAPAAQMRWWSVGILVKCLLGQTSSAAESTPAISSTPPRPWTQTTPWIAPCWSTNSAYWRC